MDDLQPLRKEGSPIGSLPVVCAEDVERPMKREVSVGKLLQSNSFMVNPIKHAGMLPEKAEKTIG